MRLKRRKSTSDLSPANQQAEAHLIEQGWLKKIYDDTKIVVYQSPDKPGYLYTLMAAIAKQRIREGAGLFIKEQSQQL